MFPVKGIGYKRYHASGNNFPDENNAPFGSGLWIIINHIKTKVYFFKIDMKRDLDPFYFCMQEHKSNQAYIAGIVPKIQAGIRRNQ
jgi:hypothetical protein